jgi:AsmA-like protein
VPGPTLLPNARGQGRVSIARLRQGKLDVSQVNSTVTFDPRSLTAPDFTLAGYGGHVSGNANFDLTHPANPAFRVKAKIDTVQADALLSAWTPAKNLLKGALSTTLDLSGIGNTPDQLRRTLTAVGQAAVANGEFGPAPALDAIVALTRMKTFQRVTFRHLDLPFKIENGKVAMRDISLNGPSGEWRASGLLGFDGALDYAVMVLVPVEQVDRLGSGASLLANALTDSQGRVRLAFRVGGTAASPRVSLDPQAMRDAAAGRVNQVLEQQKSHIEEQLKQVLNPRSGGTDSSRRADVQSLADSLKKIKGGDLLKDLLGIPRKKKAAPVDTTARDSAARESAAH